MKKLFYCLLPLFLFGCDDEFKVPKVVLDQDKMIEVMTDVQIAESYIKLKFSLKGDTIRSTDSIYAAIYRKHQISAETYDTSFQFYTNHPEVLQEIYEKAINNLATIEAINEASKEDREPDPVDALPVNSATAEED